MTYFQDGDEVYRYIGGLLIGLIDDEELSTKLKRADTTVQLRYRDPMR